MLKRVIALLLAVSLIVCLVGCGESNTKPKKKAKKEDPTDVSSQSDIVDESDVDSPIVTKTITDVVETEGSGLYLNTYKKNTSADGNYAIDDKFTLKGDKSVKNELKLGKYQYVWGDEFDGNSLNTKIWSDYDSASRGSDQKITMDAITVSGGILKCTAKRYYDPLDSNKKWITAPSISTNYSMVFQHGYLEMRARIPYKQGAWPSFWLTSGSKSSAFRDDFPNKNYSVELDIFEIISSVDTMKTTLHKWFVDGSHSIVDEKKHTFLDTRTICDEYHTYAFEWTADKITLYFDGTEWHSYNLKDIYAADKDDTKGFDQYMKIILGVGTLLSPNFQQTIQAVHLDQGDRMSDMPFEYCIDWIRLYQKPGKTAIQYLS